MAQSILRQRIIVPISCNPPILSWVCNFCSKPSRILDNKNQSNPSPVDSTNNSFQFHLSPFLPHNRIHEHDFKIELVDPDIWRVSSSLAQSWKETENESSKRNTTSSMSESVDEMVNYNQNYSSSSSSVENESEPDFDAIEDMRIRGNLFYKLDRDSREYEEYNLEFNKKKSTKKKNTKEDPKESKKNENQNLGRDEKVSKLEKTKMKDSPSIREMYNNKSSFDEVKKLRSQTYNQLTGPYHEPFCLDIYISKSSVRACIIHRATSKVVAVAHSISKDMKFDLSSTRDCTACAAVGGALAQRALGDDIHDVIYTPRKGEKLEGKLQVVLQSVIDNGINVKVKIKQRHPKKVHPLPLK